jgi:hypothetical protein
MIATFIRENYLRKALEQNMWLSIYVKLLPLILAVTLHACGSSKKRDKPLPAAPSEVQNSKVIQPTQADTADGIVSSKKLPITITGAPAQYSNANSLSLSFVSATPFMAQIFVSDERKCDSPDTLRPWLESPQKFILDSLGKDGQYSLCIMLLAVDSQSGEKIVDAMTVTWTKDTVRPLVDAKMQSSYGPGSFAGDAVTFRGYAEDSGSMLTDVLYLVRRSSDSTCYQMSSQSFTADCTSQKASGRESWSANVNKIAMTEDGEYTVQFMTADLAGNKNEELIRTFIWDASAPTAGSGLTSTMDGAALRLSWTPPASAASALVIRRAGSISAYEPVQGVTHTVGDFVGEREVVAYVGTTGTFDDLAVEKFKTYGYSVFFMDESGNYSPAISTLVTFLPSNSFLGIGSAYIIDANRNLSVNWRPYASSENIPENLLSYNIFAGPSPETTFQNTPIISVPGGTSTNVQWPASEQSKTIYFGSRASNPNISPDTNDNSTAVNTGSGAFHRIVGGNRILSQLGLNTFLSTPQGLSYSKNGNFIFNSGAGVLSALCVENIRDPFCAGRSVGMVHSIAGRDGFGDAANEEFSEHASIGEIQSTAFDVWGNLYLADIKYFRIRVICYEVTHSGACYLKKVGFMYNIAGTGAPGDSRDFSPLSSSAIGKPSSLVIDTSGNILFSDNSYYRLRIACFTALGPLCSNKKNDSLYNLAGSAEIRDGSNGEASETTAFGVVNSLQIDSDGNILFGDSTFFKIRLICRNGAPTGLCSAASGRAIGRQYSVAGNGTVGDGADGSVAEISSIGSPLDMKIDQYGNLFFSDGSFFRIRMLCLNSNPSSRCSSATPGTMLRLYGTGTSADAVDGATASTAGFGQPLKIALDGAENILIMDNFFRRIRLICQNTLSLCSSPGRTQNAQYRLVGTGSSQPIISNIPALNSSGGVTNAVATDAWNNSYWTDIQKYRIMALCSTTDGGGFCAGKIAGNAYIVAGTGLQNDGADNTAALSGGMGESHGLAIDSVGNIYWGDATYKRVRVLCINNVAPSFCQSKTILSSYRLAGNPAAPSKDSGAWGDPVTDDIGTPYAVAVDLKGNVYIADGQFWRIRIMCIDPNSSGFCLNKTGFLFRYAGKSGDAGSGDGGTDEDASSSRLGVIKAMAIDSFENLYLADEKYFRIRLICRSALGNCSGKSNPVGKIYRFAGNGAEGDAATGSPLTKAIGAPLGIALDTKDNLFIADRSFNQPRVRLICKNLSGACFDRTSTDTMYRFAGNGVSDIPPSNSSGQYLSLQPLGDSCLATVAGDSVILGTTDGGLGLIMSGSP